MLDAIPRKRVAISQSNYIPWKGYFDLIASVDVFVLYDDMQYTKRDWRNRNQIKTPNGLKWLSIPVAVKGKYHQKINDVKVLDSSWSKSHWSSLEQNYKKSQYYDEVSQWLKPFYQSVSAETHLSDINRNLIEAVCSRLGIDTKIVSSSEFELADGKTERLVDLCEQIGATHYVSGPSAKNYIDADLFKEKGIALDWFDNSGYKEYQQLYGDFEHSVTILDLLFNHGPNASSFMKFFK